MSLLKNLTYGAAALAAAVAASVAAQPTTVTCESVNYGNRECSVPGGPVALVRQLSSPPGDCIEGQSWGFNGYNNTIWVRNGCRAEFRVGYAGANPSRQPVPGMTVTCESVNYGNQECSVPGGPVLLVRQLSTPPGDCVEGQTWGFNGNNRTIWVRNGCRGEFRVGDAGAYPRPVPAPGIVVTCESVNYGNQECRVPSGPVALVRQLSTPPGDCIEGQSWGFNGYNSTIWVRNGCRAEFRAGYAGYAPPR